jgi:CheY-like chemotaxis protein
MHLITPRLLITDDDRDFRETVAGLLADRGFETLQAADGEEALQIVYRQEVHLLLLDMQMPRLSGLETIERLRRQGVSWRAVLRDELAPRTGLGDVWLASSVAERPTFPESQAIGQDEPSSQSSGEEILPAVPVPWILLSGALDEELIARARANAACSVLQKPVRLPELTGAVVAALQRVYGWHAA